MKPLTEREAFAVECMRSSKTRIEAATKYGANQRNFMQALSQARMKGHDIPDSQYRGGRNEMIPGQREGFEVKSASTLVRHTVEGSEVVLEWVKQYKYEEYEAWENAVKEICSKLPVAKVVKAPKAKPKELLTLYTITDFHMGMLSYAPETGDDWDTDIATRVLTNAIAEMVDRSPEAETGVFLQLGDFLHFDSLDSVTPSSGHLLDSDTRYDRLVRCAIHSMCNAIDMMLQKHNKVKVIIAEGNHDMAGSVWLRRSMHVIYSKNPRVEIDETSFPFYAFSHGEIMIAAHHGHKVKNKSLSALFASEPRYRQMNGNAKYTYIHTGHTHQKEKDASEYGGAIVERHQTLAARDAYATRGGWVSQRAANAITYHAEKGEYSRVTVYPDLSHN
jgi:hypothetical protein